MQVWGASFAASNVSKDSAPIQKFRSPRRERKPLTAVRCLTGEFDPLEAKQAASKERKALEARKTFGQCAEELFASKKKGWRSAKGAAQWIGSLKVHCEPVWDMPVESIDTDAVLTVLHPIWNKIPETASRVRGRIESVLNYAKASKLRSGENAAAWRGHLEMILAKRLRLSKLHFAAMDYRDVPDFIVKLRKSTSIHAAALEFIVLTACRSAEGLGARWSEIDLAAKIWTIPAARMKSGIEHRVPLSRHAIGIVERQAAIRSNEFVFPGVRIGKALSPSSLRLLRPAGGTIHGFRSSFRDWCGEVSSFPREVAEGCLSHATGNQVERAYRRGDALEKRRALMEAWDRFCGGGGNVISRLRKDN
jgi:integrase